MTWLSLTMILRVVFLLARVRSSALPDEAELMVIMLTVLCRGAVYKDVALGNNT